MARVMVGLGVVNLQVVGISNWWVCSNGRVKRLVGLSVMAGLRD